MNAVEQIKAEIERYKHKADTRLLQLKKRTLLEEAKDIALQNLCGNLLHFIKSLPKEKPSEDLKEELDRWRHHHFAGERDGLLYSGEYLLRDSQLDIARHFAEWQKAKMLEGAVNSVVYEVDIFGEPNKFPAITVSCPEGFKIGDKVKIIIVKKD